MVFRLAAYQPVASDSIMPTAIYDGRSRCVAKRTPLGERLDELNQRITNAAAKARRDPSEITLIAVTKTAAPEQVREILQLGVSDLGESRVQVLVQRASQLNEFLQ